MGVHGGGRCLGKRVRRDGRTRPLFSSPNSLPNFTM
jgi:hypothetical protein